MRKGDIYKDAGQSDQKATLNSGPHWRKYKGPRDAVFYCSWYDVWSLVKS